MGFAVLERYKEHLRDALRLQGLSAADIEEVLESIEVDRGLFLSINPRYELGRTSFRQFCADHGLSPRLPDCLGWYSGERLYAHQEEAILAILEGRTTVVSTGTGSGKTEAFLIPILDHCLKNPGPGVKALIIYPMNALANDQVRRLEKATAATDNPKVTHGLFVGPIDDPTRDAIRREPPAILITNYVMLDWMLTRSKDQGIFEASRDTLRYLVLDEIHTYRGNKAAHLKYLLARLKARLAGPVVQIGTSATLQKRGRVQGYLADDVERRDSFIRSLLGVQEYAFVEPRHEPEPAAAEGGELPRWPNPEVELGWGLEADRDTGLRNLSQLLGKAYTPFDLAPRHITESVCYRDLLQHPFLRALRKRLILDGAQSFVQIAGILSGLLPPSYPRHRVEDLAKAYLSAVAFVNHVGAGKGGPPLLDFRVHLFLRNVGGVLKRCIKCGRYHSGNQEHCQDCGFPLFCVYRDDIRKCIGKVSGNRLRWELRRESDDRRDTYFVLVRMDNGDATPDGEGELRFQDKPSADRDEIILDYDTYGRLCLTFLPGVGFREVADRTILLVDRAEEHQYLRTLVQAILDAEPSRQQKKLLAFVDNREKASRTASILQDEFASRFLEECLKLFYPRDWSPDLLDTLDLLRRQTVERQDLSDVERGVLEELDLWYWRHVSTPPREFSRARDLLRLRQPDQFSEFERSLLDIFITERAIAKPYDDDRPDSRYIRFRKHQATDHVGIHYRSGEGSYDPRYPSISLGEQAQEYAAFVREHGAEKITQAIERLVERGVLLVGMTSDGKRHCYLDPRAVSFELAPSEFRDYHEVRDRCLLRAAVHSSEVKADRRREVENLFQKGHLNLVVATPTLEMGIDIGKLQNVLMIGVPPLPSNYAQRAGRAGRGRDDNMALIVTFCSEAEHDMYYFHRPKLMIDGVISPPAFNPLNPEIVPKHVNAFMLTGMADDRRALERFAGEIDAAIQRWLPDLPKIFGSASCAESYLRDGFRQQFLEQLAKVGEHPQAELYANGFFPDYCFRRDQVYLLDVETQVSRAVKEGELADAALSEREPELAYYKFSPGETVYVGGDVYTVKSQGAYELLVWDGVQLRSYRYIMAEKQVRYAAKGKEIRRYACLQKFDSGRPFVEKGKVLGVAYDPACHIWFVNLGCGRWRGTEPFCDEGGRFGLGYELVRQALVLRFDKPVCADRRIPLSFASALDRTIKDRYGLDEGEIRLILAQPWSPDAPGIGEHYLLLYDADGNGNVPLERIYQEFDQVVGMAHQTLSECRCGDGRLHDAGCYLCLRSYNTARFGSDVDKETALMVTGYLLGKNRFRPSIAQPTAGGKEFDLELRLVQQGDRFLVYGPRETYPASPEGDWNAAIFDLLTQAVQAEFCEGMRGLRIIAQQDYLISAVNEGSIAKGTAALARLQFNLLRFRVVRAEKGDRS